MMSSEVILDITTEKIFISISFYHNDHISKKQLRKITVSQDLSEFGSFLSTEIDWIDHMCTSVVDRKPKDVLDIGVIEEKRGMCCDNDLRIECAREFFED